MVDNGNKVLDVLYQSDDNYAMVSGISIASLLENNKHLDKINVHYCQYKISEVNRRRLRDLVDRYDNARLYFIDAQPYDEIFKSLGVKAWHGVYVTWLKLLAFKDVRAQSDRILFINGHTIVNSALDDLLTLDFDNNVMALSYDALFNNHKKDIGLHETDSYYNCGIMLINHKMWQQKNLSGFIKRALAEKSDYMIADQDLCNVVFRGKIKLLSPTYNFSSAYYAYDLKKLMKVNDLKPEYFYSYDQLMTDYYSPKIIHSLFGIKGKPWEENNDHPQKQLWQKYINLTPWKNTRRPQAKHTITWELYDLLPMSLFMKLYIVAVRRKFTVRSR